MAAVHDSVRCFFLQYGLEDDIKACIAKYDGKRELMDPDLSGYHTLSNTHSMYHQPSSTWIVVGSD